MGAIYGKTNFSHLEQLIEDPNPNVRFLKNNGKCYLKNKTLFPHVDYIDCIS